MCDAAGREVEQVSALSGVRLRADCFCNPGCCAGWLGLTAEAMVANYRAGHVCWDDTDIVDGAQFPEAVTPRALSQCPSTLQLAILTYLVLLTVPTYPSP